MKKFIAIAVLPLFLVLAACGGQNTDAAAGTPTAAVSPSLHNLNDLPPSLDGKWAAVDTDNDAMFTAQIEGDHIEIDYAGSDSDPSTALYWVGTFPSERSGKIVSQGDLDKMSTALLASTSKTKAFTYKDGEISFSFSMMGVTTPVHLKKVT